MVSGRFSVAVLLSLPLAAFAWSQPNDSARALEPGARIEDVLAAGQTRSFQIAVDGGQYVQIAIEKSGLNIVARLRGPRGDEEVQVEGAEDDEPTLGLSLVSTNSGSYGLEIGLRGKSGSEGRFRLIVSEARPARLEDEQRVAAARAYAQGELLRADRSAEVLRQRLANYQSALPLWRLIGARSEETRTLARIGDVYSLLNDREKALDSLLQALPLSRAGGDHRTEAFTLHTLGFVYENHGETQQALQHYEQALVLRRDVMDRNGEATTLARVGLVYRRIGDLTKALEYYQPALALWRAVGDRRGEAQGLFYIGSVYVNLGEPQPAMEFLGKGLDLARASNNRIIEAATLGTMATLFYGLGDLRKTLDLLTQSLSLQRAIGGTVDEGVTLNNIGETQLALGAPEKALDYFRQALSLRQRIGDRRGEAVTLTQIGGAYSELEQYQTALDYYQKALPLQRAASSRAGEADTLDRMGDIRLALGEPRVALQYYDQALSLYASDAFGRIQVLKHLGSAYLSLGDRQESSRYLNDALQAARATGYQPLEGGVLYDLARLEQSAGHLQEGLARINAALDITERVRGAVAGSNARSSYLASVRSRYEFLIGLLMQLHRQHPADGFDARALEANERARARSLLDLLAESHADIRQGVDPALLEQERSLETSLHAKTEYRIQLLAGKHTEQQADDLEKVIGTLTEQYDDTENQIRARSPRYAALTQPQSLTAVEVQQLLDPDSVLLEYSLGEEQSVLWIVTPDSLSTYELPKRAEIEAAARHAYEALSLNNPAAGGDAITTLSRMVLGPVASQLGKKRLVIVADGILQYVPFAALRMADGRPLIVQHEIVHLPSASTLAVLRRETDGRKAAPKMVAVLADPVFDHDDPRVTRPAGEVSAPRSLGDGLERSAKESGLLRFDRLLASREEAKTIVALAGNRSSLEALDFEASRTTATSADLGQYRIVHIASHALVNSQHPHLSGLVFSLVDRQGRAQDGFLQLHELYNLKLNADLVVLSACQTALGKDVRGEGLIGLTRGFMYAGAPRVVASLWRVPDRATAELMKRFYEGLLRDGLRPAAALRQAQVTLSSQQRWSAPYYWAGFIVQGDWK